MSRYMSGEDAYVAVIEVEVLNRDNHGSLVYAKAYDRIGPYDKPAPAKAQVTIARKGRGKAFLDGWVEVSTGWQRLDS